MPLDNQPSYQPPPVMPRAQPRATVANAKTRASVRGRRPFALLAVLLLCAGIGASAVWFFWRQSNAAQPSFVTAVAERGDIEDTVTALGNLQPRDFVDVGTQVSGQLRTIHVEIGERVEQGDLLAEIDPTVHLSRLEANKAQLANLQAQLADKQSNLQLAEQQFQRETRLRRANATSEDAYQEADAKRRSAAAQVEALKAQIRQTESTLKGDEANLSYTKIYAPMAGTVVSQTAKRGQTLNANQQAPIILRIADLSQMTVWTQVSEADVPKLRIGMEAYFTTLGASDRRWYGKLRQINPTPDVVNNVVLYNALFDVPNPNRELMTQMSAQVFFVVGAAKDAVIVPVAALNQAGPRAARPDAAARRANREVAGGQDAGQRPRREQDAGDQPRPRRRTVTVVADDGSTSEREVRVGVMNRVSAQIVSGLEPGERVVIGAQAPNAGRRPDATRSRPPRLS